MLHIQGLLFDSRWKECVDFKEIDKYASLLQLPVLKIQLGIIHIDARR